MVEVLHPRFCGFSYGFLITMGVFMLGVIWLWWRGHLQLPKPRKKKECQKD